jgi:hypothetical protein
MSRRRAGRSLRLGCELCELGIESLAGGPFSESGSNPRERGEVLRKTCRPRGNAYSVGESAENRERSKAGLGGGTEIERCSLNLDGDGVNGS